MDDTTGVDNQLFYRHGGGAGPSGDGAGYTAGSILNLSRYSVIS